MLLRYLGASAAALITDYSIYVLLLGAWPRLSPAEASVPAYLVGIAVHYAISRRFVFPAGWLHRRRLQEFLLFFSTGVVGTAVTASIVWLVSLQPGVGVHWPKIVAIAVSFLVTYVLRKVLVFRRVQI